MLGKIKRIIKKIMLGYKSDSDSYVKFLRSHGCNIGEGVHFYSPKTTTIDEVRMKWISIGSYTKIAQGVIIFAHDYSPSVLVHTHHNVVLAGGDYTEIGSHCLIGMNSIILSGRKIGNNCIVGAGSVVTHDIPDNSVCAGNPAKVITNLDEYNEKRKESYLDDAKRNVQHFIKVNGRKPAICELHGFGFLFVERTEENWKKYYTEYLAVDNDTEDVKRAFFETKPDFESFDAFMEFCNEGSMKDEP